jgi:hypothetical protein
VSQQISYFFRSFFKNVDTNIQQFDQYYSFVSLTSTYKRSTLLIADNNMNFENLHILNNKIILKTLTISIFDFIVTIHVEIKFLKTYIKESPNNILIYFIFYSVVKNVLHLLLIF